MKPDIFLTAGGRYLSFEAGSRDGAGERLVALGQPGERCRGSEPVAVAVGRTLMRSSR